jgi:hypothetical protein
MFRRFLLLSVGALALLVVLGTPGQLHAQRMRGGFSRGFHTGFRGGFSPGFHRGVFGRPFGPGPRTFNPRFNRFDRFEDRFGGRFNRFDRFEDRFERRFNRGFFDPRVGPIVRPGLVLPFPRFFPGFVVPF